MKQTFSYIEKKNYLRVPGTALRGSWNWIKPRVWMSWMYRSGEITSWVWPPWLTPCVTDEKRKRYAAKTRQKKKKKYILNTHTQTEISKLNFKKRPELLQPCDRGTVRTLTVNWSNCSLGGTPSCRDKLPSASHAAAQGPRKKKARKRAKMEGFLF